MITVIIRNNIKSNPKKRFLDNNNNDDNYSNKKRKLFHNCTFTQCTFNF